MHDELVKKAVRWLQKPLSLGGPGCHTAVSEAKAGFKGEIADALGFRACETIAAGSVLVEVKVTRNDFLADKNKPHRQPNAVAVGNWRYYLCPEGIIKPEDLPAKWGLLWVGARGKITPIVGAVTTRNIILHREILADTRFDTNLQGEVYTLVRTLSKVAEPDALNRLLRIQNNKLNRMAKENERLRADLKNKLHEGQTGTWD